MKKPRYQSNKRRKMINYRMSDGSYASESQYVAGLKGRVITRAHYYCEGRDGIFDGTSEYMYITNKNIRKAFNNAIYNGAMKFIGETFMHNAYGDRELSWEYKLISWKIIYVSNKKFYLLHNPYVNKTFVFYGSRRLRKASKTYQNDNFSPKKQKTGIYAKQKRLDRDENVYKSDRRWKKSILKKQLRDRRIKHPEQLRPYS